MKNQTYYTSVGTIRNEKNAQGDTCPVIMVNQQTHYLDLQEMAAWAALSWCICSPEQFEERYSKLSSHISNPRRTFESCVARLRSRGLIVCGSGESEAEALYDLLSGLYIVPVSASIPVRLYVFFKAVLLNNVSIRTAYRMFCRDKRTSNEQRVMALSRQALVSTAELIKCVEIGATDISTDMKLLEALYSDTDTTCDNIADMMRGAASRLPITVAVANLYLRKQIVFERV